MATRQLLHVDGAQLLPVQLPRAKGLERKGREPLCAVQLCRGARARACAVSRVAMCRAGQPVCVCVRHALCSSTRTLTVVCPNAAAQVRLHALAGVHSPALVLQRLGVLCEVEGLVRDAVGRPGQGAGRGSQKVRRARQKSTAAGPVVRAPSPPRQALSPPPPLQPPGGARVLCCAGSAPGAVRPPPPRPTTHPPVQLLAQAAGQAGQLLDERHAVHGWRQGREWEWEGSEPGSVLAVSALSATSIAPAAPCSAGWARTSSSAVRGLLAHCCGQAAASPRRPPQPAPCPPTRCMVHAGAGPAGGGDQQQAGGDQAQAQPQHGPKPPPARQHATGLQLQLDGAAAPAPAPAAPAAHTWAAQATPAADTRRPLQPTTNTPSCFGPPPPGSALVSRKALKRTADEAGLLAAGTASAAPAQAAHPPPSTPTRSGAPLRAPHAAADDEYARHSTKRQATAASQPPPLWGLFSARDVGPSPSARCGGAAASPRRNTP